MNADEIPARDLYARAAGTFDTVVTTFPEGRWNAATPCVEWDARTLVNHIVGEDLWAERLLDGETIAAVGAELDGDLVGDDPVRAWTDASARAARIVDTVDDDMIVDLSFGPTRADEYLRQLAADHLVHAWDLAAAGGTNPRFDDDLVAAVTTWFTPYVR
jgi:uncharacterized protein (TIGR03086 family)